MMVGWMDIANQQQQVNASFNVLFLKTETKTTKRSVKI